MMLQLLRILQDCKICTKLIPARWLYEMLDILLFTYINTQALATFTSVSKLSSGLRSTAEIRRFTVNTTIITALFEYEQLNVTRETDKCRWAKSSRWNWYGYIHLNYGLEFDVLTFVFFQHQTQLKFFLVRWELVRFSPALIIFLISMIALLY